VQAEPFGVQVLPTNDPFERPNLDVKFGRATPPLRTMLMTPAIASEPYCAAAPSRSTSIRSIADTGIAFRSTPVDPRPMLPFRCTRAL
jgi:hypothetical protein